MNADLFIKCNIMYLASRLYAYTIHVLQAWREYKHKDKIVICQFYMQCINYYSFALLSLCDQN
jgi:hypothetical protein